uniref:Uncharacterized protein n=1 Tax=Vitis vinifera TaxID=29760 RepID=A5BE53_VITVI|nr:hypothetical protein VITISV_039064 [Vitis vinifera]
MPQTPDVRHGLGLAPGQRASLAALSGRSLVRVEFREAEAEALSNFVRRMWQGGDFDNCK